MRPCASVVRSPSPSESSASCERAGGRPAPSPSWCGSISSAVKSTSLRPAESIAEPVSSSRVTCPCESASSTSVSAGFASPASTRVTASATSSVYSVETSSASVLPASSAAARRRVSRKRHSRPRSVRRAGGPARAAPRASRAWCRRPAPRSTWALRHPAGVRLPAAVAKRRSQGQRQASPAPRRRSSGPSSGLSSP